MQRTYGTAMHLLDDNTSVTHCTLQDVCTQPGLGENNWGYFGIRSTGQGMVFTDNVREHRHIGMGDREEQSGRAQRGTERPGPS
ncbi:MAG: hypothetical protein IPH53_02380 [Flavobacteriales bacterium]|nr:hypothetical protein [Flavobacteriales bacterium]